MHKCVCYQCNKVFHDKKKNRKFCSKTCFGLHRVKLIELGLKEGNKYVPSKD